MTQNFNPQEWLDKSSSKESISPLSLQSVNPSKDIHTEVDKIVTRIEAAFVDITTSYADWVNIGFAFAHEFGEGGRKFFHRASRFYAGYTQTDTDKQYDQCLKSTKGGITINTFFHMAKQAGIDVRMRERGGEGVMESGSDQWTDGAPSSPHPLVPSSPPPFTPDDEPEPDDEGFPEEELPPFPDALYDHLPSFFKRVVERAVSREERDILLLGSIGTVSACLNKVFGIYDGKKVFSNLFLFVTAMASAGKGRLVLCKNLVRYVHWNLRDQASAIKQRFEIETREYNLIKGKDLSIEKPAKPPELLLFIPANSSSTGVFQLLSDNDGRGLIFETEGDTLAQAFKTDYGNYSDGFRKAFHHETINYYRRTDREYVEINCPCLSAVLSGTPKQVATLIPGAENGLLSRFMFYHMNIKPIWKDVFASGNDYTLEGHFNELGKEFFVLYKAMNENPEMQFFLTQEQKDQFHQFFTQVQDKYIVLNGMDYMATIRRLGLIAFRMAMVLTTLRLLETGDPAEKIVCSDQDFHSVLSLVQVLVKHASHVYAQLPEEVKITKRRNKKEMFLDRLPERFTNQEFISISKSLLIADRTANRYIATFCDKGLICRESVGSYLNLSFVKKGNEPV